MNEKSQVIVSFADLDFFADMAVGSQYCHLTIPIFPLWNREMPKQPIYIFSH
jgi:hypothetical protein